MKSKITKRLIFTNLIILIVALLCFYFVSVYNLFSQAKEQAEQQIFAESSTIVERTENMQNMIANIDVENELDVPNSHSNRAPQPFNVKQDSFIFPSQDKNVSIHIYCELENSELIFPEETLGFRNRITLDENAKSEIASLEVLKAGVISINNENYLALLSPYVAENGEKMLVSLLAMESVDTLTISNIVSFSIVFALLVAISFGIIYWQSMRITAPLKTLTKRTEKYANHDFSESLTVKTGDEIENLSTSVQAMVESIIAHEKSQTALFRNLSHELKTPLTAISGYAENIQNNYYEDISTPLNIIQEECVRMRDILDNLIFLSKIESNVENFSFIESNIVDIVTSSIEKIESIAILNDIDIIYDPPKEILISCDKTKLLRAFINVLSNALKHTKEYVEVQIHEDSDFVRIIILDNGDGFDKSKMNKIFSSTTGETIDGNGIGLLIVYEVIKKHGGAIEVRNMASGGAEVILKLPR